jgi:hypothetical protein
MALSADIYARFAQPAKSVADFDREYADLDNARQVNALNALKLQGTQREFAAADQARAEQGALGQLLGDPTFDRKAPNALQRLYQVAPTKAAGVIKDWRDADESKSKIDKESADTKEKTIKMVRQGLSYVFSNPTPQAALQQIALLEKQLGTDLSEYRQQVAGMQTPEQLKQWAAGHALELDKALPSFTTRDTGGAQQTLRQDPVLGTVEPISSVAKTQSPDNAATNARAAAEGAANRSVTMRGQNLTDARARDLNDTTKSAAAAAKKEAAQDKAVEKFSSTLQKEGIPELETAVAGVEAVFKRYQKPGADGKPVQGDVPGIGPLKNALPSALMSDDGKDARQALAQVRNIVLSARSGAAVTDQELRRLVEEIGTGAGMSAADIWRGIGQIRARLDKIKENAAAGVNDEVLKTYQERGGIPIKRGGTKGFTYLGTE